MGLGVQGLGSRGLGLRALGPGALRTDLGYCPHTAAVFSSLWV